MKHDSAPMKPLKDRCLVLSVMAHALLLIVILVGSAFKSPRSTTAVAPFELSDFKLTDLDLNTGAANSVPQPQLAPPRPAPAPSQSATTPNTVRTPDLSSRPRIIPIDPKNLHRRTVQTSVENGSSESPSARTEFAQQKFQQALRNLSDGLSGATVVTSPGPNNVAYLNYGAYLKRLYEQSWIPPASALGQEPAVEVEVTISKVGQVLSTRVLKKSGRPNLDNSVQNVLDRVKAVQPFPEGSPDQERTFKINFNLTAKLGAG
jgi:TonB family protein